MGISQLLPMEDVRGVRDDIAIPCGNASYTIMPCTSGEGMLGMFVLSVMSEYEFDLSRARENKKNK